MIIGSGRRSEIMKRKSRSSYGSEKTGKSHGIWLVGKVEENAKLPVKSGKSRESLIAE